MTWMMGYGEEGDSTRKKKVSNHTPPHGICQFANGERTLLISNGMHKREGLGKIYEQK